MNKQIVIYPYNVILLSYKKEWSTDTCDNVDEPQEHYSKWKKPDTEVHILYDFIFMKISRTGKSNESEAP